MIEMRVVGIVLDPTNNTPIIILKDKKQKRTLPIWVGIFEASAIAMELEGVTSTRPLTHDLMKSIINKLNGKILRVVIDGLKDNTFFAKVWIKRGKKEIDIDARPSDAIALALRSKVSIYVMHEVIDGVAKLNVSEKEGDKQDLRKLLEGMSTDDFGKYKM